jgi:hypothetical protein
MMGEVYKNLTYPRKATRRIIWEFIRVLFSHLAKGETVLLTGIGQFRFKDWIVRRSFPDGKRRTSRVIKWQSSHSLARQLHLNTEEVENVLHSDDSRKSDSSSG